MADMNEFGMTEGFDASTVESNRSFDVLPAGDYPVMIVSSEVKATANGDGKYLKLKLQILDGPGQNRTLFDNLNIANKNETAQNIARGSLKAICEAVGIVGPLKRSEDLHTKKLIAKVGAIPDKRADHKGEFQNVVKQYKPFGAATVAVTPANPAGYKF